MHFTTFTAFLKIIYILRECFYYNSNIEILNMIKVGANFKLFNKELYCCLPFVAKVCFIFGL